jgi:hypothetical protein
VIVLPLPTQILICSNALLVIGNEHESMVSENLLKLLLLDILAVQHLFKLLESSFYCWAVSWIWMPHYTIIIQFLCDVMHHILGWR